MEINLFFDKNREIQKSLSFTEGNGFSHSLSYYLDSIKQDMSINDYFFVDKFYNGSLDDYIIRGVFKKYIDFYSNKDSESSIWFKTISDKLYNINNPIFAYYGNFKRKIGICNEPIFGIKDMTMFINETDGFYAIEDKENMPLFDSIRIKTKTDSKHNVRRLSQLMLGFNIKELLQDKEILYVGTETDGVEINSTERHLDTEIKKAYINQTIFTGTFSKELFIDIYQNNIDIPTKEIFSKMEFKSATILNKGIDTDNGDLSVNKTDIGGNLNKKDLFMEFESKSLKYDLGSCNISNGNGNGLAVNDVFFKMFSKHNKDIFEKNTDVLINKNNKDVEINKSSVLISKYFKPINYETYIRFGEKFKYRILPKNEDLFINKSVYETTYDLKEMNVNYSSRKLYNKDSNILFKIIDRKMDLNKSYLSVDKISKELNINKDNMFLYAYRDNYNSINMFNNLKTFTTMNRDIFFYDSIFNINKYGHKIFGYDTCIWNISKDSKPIFQNDTYNMMSIDSKPINYAQDTSIMFDKNGKPVFEIDVEWYKKYQRKTMFNEISEEWFDKKQKPTRLEYHILQFRKDWINTRLEYDILGFNKSWKHTDIDDNIYTISKNIKDTMIEYENTWITKLPKSVFEKDTIFRSDKFVKDIYINKDYISLIPPQNKIVINKYFYFMNKEDKKANKEKDKTLLFKFAIGIDKNKDLFSNRKVYDVYAKQPINFFYRTKYGMFSTNQVMTTMNQIDTAIDDEIYTFTKEKKDTRLDYDSPFVTVMHYDGDMKPDLGQGKIDELILPHHDFDYDKYLSRLINDDGTINMAYVKRYDSATETYTVKIPIENPMDIYEDIGREYVDLSTNTLEILLYIVRTLWKDNMYKYMAMSAQDSLKDIIIKSNDYINTHYTLDAERRYEFDRALQLFRWYSEMAIINNCEYDLKFDTTSEKVNYLSRDLGTLHDMIELNNMHISRNLILEPIDNTKPCYIKFINNKKNVLSSPNLSFTLYNVNAKSSISIIDRSNSISTNIYNPGMYELNDKLENECKVEFVPTSNDQSIAIAKIKISNIQIPSFTVTYKGVFGEMNSVMKELLKQLLVVGSVVPPNVQDKLKDVTAVTSAVSRFQEYFEIHHKDKDKGKRLITKK